MFDGTWLCREFFNADGKRADHLWASCSQPVEILGERLQPLQDMPRLLLAHHVAHLDPAQGDSRGGHQLEPEHRSSSAFDGTIVLFNPVIQVGTLPNVNGLPTTPQSSLKPVCGIAG